MPTEAQVLAHVVDRTRQYNRLYLSALKDVDPHRQFVCEGVELNTQF